VQVFCLSGEQRSRRIERRRGKMNRKMEKPLFDNQRRIKTWQPYTCMADSNSKGIVRTNMEYNGEKQTAVK
jgi:hypothetical protein